MPGEEPEPNEELESDVSHETRNELLGTYAKPCQWEQARRSLRGEKREYDEGADSGEESD